MNKANDIKTLIEQHDWVAARAALDSVPADSMAQSERLFLEGLLAANISYKQTN